MAESVRDWTGLEEDLGTGGLPTARSVTVGLGELEPTLCAEYLWAMHRRGPYMTRCWSI